MAEDSATGLTRRLRPEVPMHLLTCVPAVCALGICRGLREAGDADACVRWPSDVVLGDGSLIRLGSHAGYEEGMYVDLALSLEGEGADPDLLERAGAWAL